MAPGRTGRRSIEALHSRLKMTIWLSTAWRLGGQIPIEGTSRLARMSNADTYNSRPGSKMATRFCKRGD